MIIKNKQGENIAGILMKNKATDEIIIICHGSRGHKNAQIQKFLAENLSEKFNTFRFDFSGNGESDGLIEDSTYSKEISDLRSVVKSISKKYKIKAVIGYSKSASQVLIDSKFLSSFSDIIIAIAPRIDLRQAQEFVLSKKYKKDLEKNNYYIYPSKAKQKITRDFLLDIEKIGSIENYYYPKAKTVIIHGKMDKTIPFGDSLDFSKKSKDIRLIGIENAGHSFSSQENKKDMLQAILKSIY